MLRHLTNPGATAEAVKRVLKQITRFRVAELDKVARKTSAEA